MQIVCAYDLCKNGGYPDRYKVVLDKMFSQVEKPMTNSIESIIDFVYEKLLALDEIRYLRADDFIRVFDGQSILFYFSRQMESDFVENH